MAARRRLNQAARRALEQWVGAPPVPAARQLKRPVTDKQGLQDRLRRLEARLGGPKGAAEAIGVSRDTYRKWDKGVVPRAVNLDRVEAAHQAVLQAEADTMPARRAQLQLLAASGANPWVGLVIAAEYQVDGYYNGQKDTVAQDEPAPPLPDNDKAHRPVKLGQHAMRPILETYAAGGNLGTLLESYAREVITPKTFTNDYYAAPKVRFKEGD
jgi:hypothetical protein